VINTQAYYDTELIMFVKSLIVLVPAEFTKSQAWQGMAGHGRAWPGMARHGVAWLGLAWLGLA